MNWIKRWLLILGRDNHKLPKQKPILKKNIIYFVLKACLSNIIKLN